MPPADEARLRDMVDAGQQVRRLVDGVTLLRYEAERPLQWAVERGIEIIGEAARGVSREVQETHPEIPWRLIIAQRHVIAHDYGEILNERIWRVATRDLPALLDPLTALLSPDAGTC